MNTERTDLCSEIPGQIDSETRLLAAIAYGEASVDDISEEILGIAHAVVNRAKVWGKKKVSEIISADPNYTYAANGKCVRFNLLKSSTIQQINQSRGMRIAVNSAIDALKGKGSDPSNDAYWWDGLDLKDKKSSNPRIQYGFKYGDPSHNIFSMQEIKKTVIIYWQIRNKKTGKIENSKERGRFDCVYRSTAAYGGTIFWRYSSEYVSATGAKEYK